MFCRAEVRSGRVVGFDHGPVKAFRGVPYAASTAGANRFKGPQKLRPWSGARECFGAGQASPQAVIDPRYGFAHVLHFNLAAIQAGLGEDCLHLNLWTPSIDRGAKRPVLVNFHGGAFANGSGDLPLYDGGNLAVQGDVVVVSVTHRLNAFGFLALSGSNEFANAGVAGLLDLIASLEWVKDNIESFGGDPANVTIFGQSGGGWKVSALLAMPSASGLFHRAAIQSGSLLRVRTPEEGAALTVNLLSQLELKPRDIGKLANMPWQDLFAAALKVGLHAFEPVLDGRHLQAQIGDPNFPELSRDIPLLISTTLDDGSLLSPALNITEDEVRSTVKAKYGDVGDAMIELYRAHYPDISPFLLLGRVTTDAGFRRFANAQTERKAKAGGAPLYTYRWDWTSPVYDGAYGAAHATDVPATFGNVHDPMLGGGSAAGARLSQELLGAFVAFARTGAPGSDWPAFDLQDRNTMIFDTQSKVLRDPDGEVRKFWDSQPMATSVLG